MQSYPGNMPTRRLLLAASLSFSLCLSASAEGAPSLPSSRQPASHAPLSLTPPEGGQPLNAQERDRPVSGPRSCIPFFPSGVQSLQGKRLPLVFVRIGLDGKMHDPQLPVSSGDAAIDKTLLACADGQPLLVVTIGGRPAEVQWFVAYQFVSDAHWDGFLAASANGRPRICSNWPEAAVRRNAQGDAAFTYAIGIDGSTKNIKLTKSTGDLDLDQATLECVGAWRYFPARQNGKPVEIELTGQARWRVVG